MWDMYDLTLDGQLDGSLSKGQMAKLLEDLKRQIEDNVQMQPMDGDQPLVFFDHNGQPTCNTSAAVYDEGPDGDPSQAAGSVGAASIAERRASSCGCGNALGGQRRGSVATGGHRASAQARASSMDAVWARAHPKYLQSDALDDAFCDEIERADDVARRRDAAKIGASSREGGAGAAGDEGADEAVDYIWTAIREEARRDAAREPMLSSSLYASVLSHDTLEQSLSFVLANKLADSTLLPTQLMEIFNTVLTEEEETAAGAELREAVRADVAAFKERDPACVGYSHALLLFKGFHALESHRIQHALWNRGQRLMALAMQSRISAVFSMDIHPAARLGKGILIDHGTGVVIGETCVIGDSVSILQGVTLGGTGKAVGDRHPKIESHVLIGAHSTVLGNIKVERGSMISAGSLVLKPVAAHTMVAGSPAKVVGKVRDSKPSLVMDHHITPMAPTFCDDLEEAVRRQVSEEKEKWTRTAEDEDRVRSQVISADEKRRRRRDRGSRSGGDSSTR